MAKRPAGYRWANLSREQQDRYLRLLWNDGYSEAAIAKFFHVGKGAIVRRRQSHLKDLAPRDRSAVKSNLSIDRFHDLLDIDKMDDMVDRGVIPMGPVEAEPEQHAHEVTHRLANPWNQCQYSGGCAYERLPGLMHCGRPGHDK